MDEAAAVPGPGDLVDPSQFFPEPEDRPRVGPEYQAVVPDAVDPEIAAAARAQSRIKSQIVAPSLVADGPAAGEALAALVEDVSRTSGFCVLVARSKRRLARSV